MLRMHILLLSVFYFKASCIHIQRVCAATGVGLAN